MRIFGYRLGVLVKQVQKFWSNTSSSKLFAATILLIIDQIDYRPIPTVEVVLWHLRYLHSSCVFVLTTNQHQPFVKRHLSLSRSIKRYFISKQMFCKDFFSPKNKAFQTKRCFLSNNTGSTCTVIFNFFCKVGLYPTTRSCGAKLTANVTSREMCTGINHSLYLAFVQNSLGGTSLYRSLYFLLFGPIIGKLLTSNN